MLRDKVYAIIYASVLPRHLKTWPPRLDLRLSHLTIYVLGKKWETSGLGSRLDE